MAPAGRIQRHHRHGEGALEPLMSPRWANWPRALCLGWLTVVGRLLAVGVRLPGARSVRRWHEFMTTWLRLGRWLDEITSRLSFRNLPGLQLRRMRRHDFTQWAFGGGTDGRRRGGHDRAGRRNGEYCEYCEYCEY